MSLEVSLLQSEILSTHHKHDYVPSAMIQSYSRQSPSELAIRANGPRWTYVKNVVVSLCNFKSNQYLSPKKTILPSKHVIKQMTNQCLGVLS